MSTVTLKAAREHRVTVPSLQKRKGRGEPIAMLTAYDFTFARIFDTAGIDVLLVGDSLGNVVQGHDTTLPVTLEETIYHTRLVSRAAARALVVADMPFGSFQISPEDALRNAVRCVKEGGAHAVKLEGGVVMAATIERIVTAEIPVMGHVGLTPQAVHRMGGHRVQGRSEDGAQRVLEDARAVEAAGAFAVVLEGLPADLARAVTQELVDSHDRDRRGRRLRRSGARDARHARALRLDPELREDLCRTGRTGGPGRAPLRGRGARAQVPRSGALVPLGRQVSRSEPKASEDHQQVSRSEPQASEDHQAGERMTMDRIDTVRALQARSDEERAAGRRIALVPTMGALHAGHASLFKVARQRADRVWVSIFVNPTQFDDPRDLAAYPRTLAGDLDLCRDAGVDVVFTPDAAQMYPEGAQTIVEVGALAAPLCGAARPGHFRGVATVVTKLLAAAKPHVAVFGEKDFQQLAVIRQLARDLLLDVEIVGAPTLREPDGLALSSRNRHLDVDARRQAVALVRALDAAESAVAAGERDAALILALVRAEIAAAPRARIDYAELRDPITLAPAPEQLAGPALLALAVFMRPTRADGKTVRLIDNRVLQPQTRAGGASS